MCDLGMKYAQWAVGTAPSLYKSVHKKPEHNEMPWSAVPSFQTRSRDYVRREKIMSSTNARIVAFHKSKPRKKRRDTVILPDLTRFTKRFTLE
jgi:hypothetical protein